MDSGSLSPFDLSFFKRAVNFLVCFAMWAGKLALSTAMERKSITSTFVTVIKSQVFFLPINKKRSLLPARQLLESRKACISLSTYRPLFSHFGKRWSGTAQGFSEDGVQGSEAKCTLYSSNLNMIAVFFWKSVFIAGKKTWESVSKKATEWVSNPSE